MALIIGAGPGISGAFAKELVKAGYIVALAARDMEKLKPLAESIGAHAFKVDANSIDDIQKLHVQTFPMRDTPKRVAHHNIGRLFVVGAISNGSDGILGKEDQGEVLYFLDDISFEEIHW